MFEHNMVLSGLNGSMYGAMLTLLLLLHRLLLRIRSYAQRSPCTALSTSVHKSLRSPYNCAMECHMFRTSKT